MAQIPDFTQSKILIVGDIMLDRYWSGATARISPEAPVPVVNVNDIEDRPGGAANVAVNAAALGAKVSLLGLVGRDETSNILRTQLEARNVDIDFITLPEFDTITKLRVMSRNQQLLRLDFEKSFVRADKTALLEKYKSKLSHVNVVVLSDYNKGCLSEVEALIALAKEADVPVIIDPKGSDFSKYAGASVITPNMSEFTQAFAKQTSSQIMSEDELHQLASDSCAQLNLENILLTRSEQGMSLFSALGKAHHLPALAKEVFDVTGAGDTVVSTLACAVGANTSMEHACQLANHAAGVVVAKLGTSTATTTELALAINSHKSMDGGQMSEAQLLVALEESRNRAERIVFTNGCFDILHAGHVSYLNEAAALGDRLIVGVNSDSSVKALKGEGRPVNNAARRMAVLAGLSAVDWVVEFSEETPQRLIQAVLPDVLVKGGDYAEAEIVGSAEVKANGGQVKVLTFEDGVSTTGIISQILENDNR
ncbi:bifunctional D-glycero-beta-D-manno-heptose-7-phosphate kinase/D-glycero-beta-D-manno-heptose 1-phosphate adenylyltransferase HldE [Ningiella sp. W23]|uniref:bifunctional D-glycero-beta-D-manno-heptose-7-phosphate kinase/D-glycero-beta-D-manno-heptose 1-phosphate adenylyltransferase HldE n=1 Tax=Ningiella sp. W23 TaxID=3023715 RepID=UPI00375647A2